MLAGYCLEPAQGTLSDHGIASAVSRAVGFWPGGLPYVMEVGEGLVAASACARPLRRSTLPWKLAALEATEERYGRGCGAASGTRRRA